MDILRTILIVLAILIVLYLIINFFFTKSTTLTNMMSGRDMQVVEASTLPNNNNTSNYTYSTWFYVDDWNYRFGEPKVLLERRDADGSPSPSIVFSPMENDITISVTCYPQSNSTGAVGNNGVVHKCSIRNFPLQSWVNLLISMYGRTLDVYVDGKLVRTCVLPGVAKINNKSNIIVTPQGGFSGYTANFQYWDVASNPQQAFDIYRAGFGGSLLGNLFNKYRIRISFLEDNQEQGSLEI
jgi:hypothetical protein